MGTWRKTHMSLDITGAMKSPQMFVGNITVEGKTLWTIPEIMEFFQSQLDMGRRVLPLGDCDNFDYQTGCRGHIREVSE
jgi:hypothetical protein